MPRKKCSPMPTPFKLRPFPNITAFQFLIFSFLILYIGILISVIIIYGTLYASMLHDHPGVCDLVEYYII